MLIGFPVPVTLSFLAGMFFVLAAAIGERRFAYMAGAMLCFMLLHIAVQSGPYLYQAKKTMLSIQRTMR